MIELLHYTPGKPLVIWCSHRSFEASEHMIECIEKTNISPEEYSLAVFYADDWNRDYSPWYAYNPVNDSYFAGEGLHTEKQLTEEILEIKNQLEITEIILCGYSLAGLFALWMGLKSSLINGIICCSGSMWYDGFIEYLQNIEISSNKRIYLSLGGKEKITQNQTMQTIEEKTRKAEKILKTKQNILSVCFKLNPGGHFADSCKRMADGINWIVKHTKAL